MKHIPVLLDRVLETIGDIRRKTVVDCTFGAGGYTRAFLERGANVIAFDRDQTVIPTADEISAEYKNRFEFINKPFSAINELNGRKIDAVVFDLGISSMQIDNGDRGFSFRFDGPLDMRMDLNSVSAADLIKNSSVEKLVEILRDFGDVKKAKPIAAAMKDKLPKTTFELRDLIYDPRDVATVFQALRMAVNDELGQVRNALESVPALLAGGGMCICVTFHSIEDRLVKNVFREWTNTIGDPRMPTVEQPRFQLMRTFNPSAEELESNTRARSAHLRAVKKY